MKERYAGKVKLIYIDPPYNTGNDSFQYNDRFNQSTWLTFMKNRLFTSKKLLKSDGLIFVHIDRNQFAELKILMDEIFEGHYLGTIINISTPNGRDYGSFAQTNDFIHVYANDMSLVKTNALDVVESKFSLTDNKSSYYLHPLFNSNSAFHNKNRPNLYYPFYANPEVNEEGYHSISLKKDRDHTIELYPPKSKTDGTQFVWRWGKDKAQKNLNIDIVAQKMNNGTYRIAQKMRPKKQIPRTVWQGAQYSNRRGTEELQKLFSEKVFSYPKPEALLEKIIEIGSNEGDLILDFHMGSATTQAVAHKMGRQYIGIEQMDYIETVSVPRLQKVIDGEQGGVSKDVDWQGGGSFVYAELYSLNEMYVAKIQTAKSEAKLNDVLTEMKENAHLNFKVDFERLTSDDEGYDSLTLEQKKKVLIGALDMNQLYLNYSEIEDTQYNIPEEVKKFNHSFYNKDGD